MKPPSLATLALATALAIAWTSPAFAQDEEPTETGGALDDGQFSAFLTTTSGITATSGGASSAAMATMVAYTPDKDGRLSMARYLTDHARGVREACALGAGHVVDDLALALDTPRRVDLARALRARRELLLPLVSNETVSPEQAGHFIDLLVSQLDASALDPTKS